jgi:hypothetical protein
LSKSAIYRRNKKRVNNSASVSVLINFPSTSTNAVITYNANHHGQASVSEMVKFPSTSRNAIITYNAFAIEGSEANQPVSEAMEEPSQPEELFTEEEQSENIQSRLAKWACSTTLCATDINRVLRILNPYFSHLPLDSKF